MKHNYRFIKPDKHVREKTQTEKRINEEHLSITTRQCEKEKYNYETP